MRLIAILLCCAFTAAWSFPQTPSSSPTPKHKTKVQTKYDTHKNETELRIGPLDLWKPPDYVGSGELTFERVDLFVYFSFPGKKIVTPGSVTLLVFSFSQWGAQLEKRPGISISTDSGNYDLGNLEIVSINKERVMTRISPPATDILTTEVVRKPLPFDDFTRVAQSKRAEIKLGDRKFKFTDEHLEAFRNFVTLMKQQGLEF